MNNGTTSSAVPRRHTWWAVSTTPPHPPAAYLTMFWLVPIFWIGGLTGNSAVGIKRVVDDTFGVEVTSALPIYSPQGAWNYGQNCTGCTIRPDDRLAYKQTWHDTTQHPYDGVRTVTVIFSGTFSSYNPELNISDEISRNNRNRICCD